ncbi:MAG TPA: bifunctional nuclease family protein [Dictyoglomaceae bacterium]|nr:bifunctional nuclease family protein [Dictyoglomaceae bacterium]HOL39456.1 bifunctional nuclease family protein [Dictyoglomaceae bacterium]HPP15403.1 bifunctional nuclease family protein [Dictyoglomaceae bacterium]HPU43850.1 bifunctional nuclease family protein [Dictyoglomaceae bacterium]
MMVEVYVVGLSMDPQTNQFVVLLKEKKEGKRILPIWIGPFEANAIAVAIEKIDIGRPLTHDLIKNILEVLNVKVDKVFIHSLKENTFYATIYLISNDKVFEIDSRPSDAMALALRTDSPIFVDSQILENAGFIEEYSAEEELTKLLQELNPEEFKKQ